MKIARPTRTVTRNVDYSVLIFGRIIIFKKLLNALTKLNVTQK